MGVECGVLEARQAPPPSPPPRTQSDLYTIFKGGVKIISLSLHPSGDRELRGWEGLMLLFPFLCTVRVKEREKEKKKNPKPFLFTNHS